MLTRRHFLSAFPPPACFGVTVVSANKKQVHLESVCTTAGDLAQKDLPAGHAFFRPLASGSRQPEPALGVFMVDIDRPEPGKNRTPAPLHVVMENMPFALVQTSPGNMQAWFHCPEADTPDALHAVRGVITKRLGGDPGSCKRGQFGRLPGLAHPIRDCPVLVLMLAPNLYIGLPQGLPQGLALGPASPAPLVTPVKRRADSAQDRSVVDLRLAMAGVARGATHAEIIRVLLAQSPKAKERMSSAGDVAARAYAESIVQSAERALESGDARVCEGLP